MCGICMILEISDEHSEDWHLKALAPYEESLQRRGPDASNFIKLTVNKTAQLLAYCSILWLQGSEPTTQPVTSECGDALLWNGDILAGIEVPDGQSDTSYLYELLRTKCETGILEIFGKIKGPWSMIYYHKHSNRLYFGRDVFGRHSLLWSEHRINQNTIDSAKAETCNSINVQYSQMNLRSNPMVITSVGNSSQNLEEIPAYGIYSINMNDVTASDKKIKIKLFPWNSVSTAYLNDVDVEIMDKKLISPIDTILNKSEPNINEDEIFIREQSENYQNFDTLSSYPQFEIYCHHLTELLTLSIERRVRACPPQCLQCTRHTVTEQQISHSHEQQTSKSSESQGNCQHSRIAVLFSGGLDSAVLALLLDRCLPKHEQIDLINVAFPQRVARPNKPKTKSRQVNASGTVSCNLGCFDESHSPSCINDSTNNVHYEVPDRVTGRATHAQLSMLCPGRTFNFVQVDVSASELLEARETRVKSLLAPHCTVLDDSIGCALWFAARGVGTLNGRSYTSRARVLLSGLGADEQLCGYSRHRSVFSQRGWRGLLQEVQLEEERIHARNCGRDNRVMADHARAPRFPYLDEDVVSWLHGLPLWHKCNLHLPRGVGEKLLLRVLAHKLGLTHAALLPKRAIQFGSRIAKMEDSKEKGNQQCTRLTS